MVNDLKAQWRRSNNKLEY